MNNKEFTSVFFAALIWGGAAPLIKLIDMHPFSLLFIRLVVPALISAMVLSRQGRLKSLLLSSNRLPWLASLLNMIRMYLFIVALGYASVSNAIILAYSSPLFSTLFGFLYLREKPPVKTLAALALGGSGVVLVYWNHFSLTDSDFIGMTMMLGSAITYACTNVLVKKDLEALSPMETIFYQNSLGAVLAAPIFLSLPLPTDIKCLQAVLYALSIGFISFLLYYRGLKGLPIAMAVSITYLEVVIAVTLSVILFDEVLTTELIFGCLLIFVGTILVRLEAGKPTKAEAAFEASG